MELIVTLMIVVCVYMIGFTAGQEDYRDACITKYSDMPHNQVKPFCKKLLKFEKDTK